MSDFFKKSFHIPISIRYKLKTSFLIESVIVKKKKKKNKIK